MCKKRLGNMPDHCTLKYKLAVDFSCQQISGGGGRCHFPLVFAHFFIKKSFFLAINTYIHIKNCGESEKMGLEKLLAQEMWKKKQKKQKIM